MLGKRDHQGGLYSAKTRLGEKALEKMGFYGKVAREGHRIFRDSDFASLYSASQGRPSVPPSLLALAFLLQCYDNVSDAEAIDKTRYDMRWKVALDLDLDTINPAFAKSTLQLFRARLMLHQKEGLAFERSIQEAVEAGLLPQRLRLAVDSSPVRGRGAVRDTYNLLSDAIRKVVRRVADETAEFPMIAAKDAGVVRHFEQKSIKGTDFVDWSDEAAVSGFLKELLEDCRKAVAYAKKAKCASEELALLEKVIADDVEEDPPDENGGEPGPRLRKGVTEGRTVSVHDPEMRHGHKSNGKLYSGHKAHLAVDTESGIITAVDVTEPARPEGSLLGSLVERTEVVTGSLVEEALGDCAYSTRQALKAGRRAAIDVVAKMPKTHRKGFFGSRDFIVSADRRLAVCPAGKVSAKVHRQRDSLLLFWSPSDCQTCVLKAKCTKARKRSLQATCDFHERRRREDYASSREGRELLRHRVVVEHAIGRLKNFGAGQARRFGRRKTWMQWLWTAAVVNLMTLWRGTHSDGEAIPLLSSLLFAIALHLRPTFTGQRDDGCPPANTGSSCDPRKAAFRPAL